MAQTVAAKPQPVITDDFKSRCRQALNKAYLLSKDHGQISYIAGSSRPPNEKIQAAIGLLDWFQVRAREFHTGDLSGFSSEMIALYARLASEAKTDDDLAGDLIDLVLAELGRRGFAADPQALDGVTPE